MSKFPSKREISREFKAGGKAIVPAARELISALTLGTSDRFINAAKALDDIERIYKASKLECLYVELINEELSEEKFSAFCDASDVNKCDVAGLMQKAIETSVTRAQIVLASRIIRGVVKERIGMIDAVAYSNTIGNLRGEQIVTIAFMHRATEKAAIDKWGALRVSGLPIYNLLNDEVVKEAMNHYREEMSRNAERFPDLHLDEQYARAENAVSSGMVRERSPAPVYGADLEPSYQMTAYGFLLCDAIQFHTVDLSEFETNSSETEPTRPSSE